MGMVDWIRKKRDGQELTTAEIEQLVAGYTEGRIPDYQVSAWAMAVYFQGMSARETADLTMAIVKSGAQVDLSAIHGKKVDKHSTGGVGDTTTLVLGPLVAACGVPVSKLSGRGLGHTGGTIDKLEAIPGFSTEMGNADFSKRVNEISIALAGQSKDLTPADKQLYALRDVTATVDSIPLIASSIMSKKIASGADSIVLDVKYGQGAFMKNEEDAVQLAQAMVAIGDQVGRETVALISNMNQPLGQAIGNALEVQEAIDTLRGRGPQDLTELCLALGAHMVSLAKDIPATEARQQLQAKLTDGTALEKFRQFVVSQGGDAAVIDDATVLPQAPYRIPVIAEQAGYISSLQAEEVGLCAMQLGAGRETKESVIDLSVGVLLHKKVGDAVEMGEEVATLYANEQSKAEQVRARLLQAISISSEMVEPPALIHSVITKDGIQYLA
ncbi:pyrimidine-nucleoside phosphorylase [Mechercharimyces sp. CAU 1602]|uniref:pyrimidine-nucleoside phosphorylase n=1 Tax=Mechercharimyces sp. CAU 1602 TaxID=2973933 RepID=UPI002162DDA2|nr:pyrimidine-nucleoside phosphorylase [Mechercharimyces sp. CAU 1602]MCS1350838.1 pyrimidine-nucleoside phosphorylase [Mechercharimyces sp. CAU 1602]